MAAAQHEEGRLALELRRAGVLTHPERLQRLAEQAWREHPGEREGGERRRVVSNKLREGLLWSLIEQWRPEVLGQAIGWLLDQTMPEELREAAREHEPQAIEIFPPPPQRRVVPLHEKRIRRAQAMATTFNKTLSKLDTVLIYGKPIGDCTVADVRVWADQREAEGREAIRDVRFARNLIANLPSGERIRDWWKQAEEVDRLYAVAELGGQQQPLLLDPPDNQ